MDFIYSCQILHHRVEFSKFLSFLSFCFFSTEFDIKIVFQFVIKKSSFPTIGGTWLQTIPLSHAKFSIAQKWPSPILQARSVSYCHTTRRQSNSDFLPQISQVPWHKMYIGYVSVFPRAKNNAARSINSCKKID